MINVPNLVTVARVILALVTAGLIWLSADSMRWLSLFFTIIVIWGDGLDGYLARKLNQCTKLGAVLDIAGDRVVEMTYWIAFAALGWLPVWIPLIFLVRGTFVDAMRAQASELGKTAFGEKTMMETPVGKFLVASNFSRFTYAVVKALAFCLVIAAHTTALQSTSVPAVALALSYFATFFCIMRGLPVLIEGRRLLAG